MARRLRLPGSVRTAPRCGCCVLGLRQRASEQALKLTSLCCLCVRAYLCVCVCVRVRVFLQRFHSCGKKQARMFTRQVAGHFITVPVFVPHPVFVAQPAHDTALRYIEYQYVHPATDTVVVVGGWGAGWRNTARTQ